MAFLHPWWLLGLVAIGAAALWALFRPGRQIAVVASLSLWSKALGAVDRSLLRSVRRVTASWLLLLAGAVAAILAAAGPVYQKGEPSRQVAIALWPSAELVGEGMTNLRVTAKSLLGRLDSRDRVQIVLPTLLGGAGKWLPPAEAVATVDALQPIAATAAELVLPAPDSAAQAVYCITPAGVDISAMPNAVRLEVATSLPPAIIDAFGVEPSNANAMMFAAIRNTSMNPWHGNMIITAGDGESVQPVEIQPGSRAEFSKVVKTDGNVAAAWLTDVAHKPLAGIGTSTAAVLGSAANVRLAFTGADEPLLRRFAGADSLLKMVAKPKDSDIVIAIGEEAPDDKPAMLINPRRSPPGWQRAGMIGPLDLANASLAADDPLMRGVDFSGVAVRAVRPWVAAAPITGLKQLASYGGQGLILSSQSGVIREPRRIYVAMDLSPDNSSLAMRDAFVVFLANAVRWLAPPSAGSGGYEFVRPIAVGYDRDWKRVEPNSGSPAGGPLPWPGVYRDGAGRLHAVNLLGLGGSAMTATAQAEFAGPLPQPRYTGGQADLWPALLAATMGLWLAGWILRVR